MEGKVGRGEGMGKREQEENNGGKGERWSWRATWILHRIRKNVLELFMQN
jgi:hypothetical protein